MSSSILASKKAFQSYQNTRMEELNKPKAVQLTYRELAPEEFQFAPREVINSEVFTPENSRIIAAINEEGEIVSTWTIFLVPHAEPFWIRPDYRHHPSIIKHMAKMMVNLFKELNSKNVYTVVLDDDQGRVLTRLANWFGFSPIKGKLFIWKGGK